MHSGHIPGIYLIDWSTKAVWVLWPPTRCDRPVSSFCPSVQPGDSQTTLNSVKMLEYSGLFWPIIQWIYIYSFNLCMLEGRGKLKHLTDVYSP